MQATPCWKKRWLTQICDYTADLRLAGDKVLCYDFTEKLVLVTPLFFSSVPQGALSERPQMFLDQIQQCAEVTCFKYVLLFDIFQTHLLYIICIDG